MFIFKKEYFLTSTSHSVTLQTLPLRLVVSAGTAVMSGLEELDTRARLDGTVYKVTHGEEFKMF